ncbi:MAG TPA: cytochrome C oxidase subunit II [Acidobacteriaceae bacterium]|jgi:cytochrome c oxidase subunit 2|nr:cytochrome C oxidase subunit II [Acidobacteriaceae bacterium]
MDWLPPNGALHGIALDRLLNINLALVFWIFVAAQILLVLALVWRPRASAKPSRTLLILDYAALAAFAGLYLWMLVSGHRLWAARRESASPSNAVKVEVTGVQFQWYFRYPGPDGQYGRTAPTLVSAPAGNPLGLDPTDPRSRDDIVSAILVLPAGQPVDLTLRAQDVIHGFFIPGMRLKQDAIPGRPGHLQFTPIATGDYPILCSQVCGLGHARMQSRLRVVSPPDYNRWLATREKIVEANAP